MRLSLLSEIQSALRSAANGNPWPRSSMRDLSEEFDALLIKCRKEPNDMCRVVTFYQGMTHSEVE